MSVQLILGDFFFVTVIYMIVAVQVDMGFPPFYRKFAWWLFSANTNMKERAIRMMLPFVFAMMGAMVLAVAVDPILLFVLGGLIAIVAGLRMRQHLAKTVGLPLPWISNPWTVRWPMLLFDVWTIGVSLGSGAAMLSSK